MSAPVAPSQFCDLVPSPTSSICTRIKNVLIVLPAKLCALFSYMFDSDGNPSNEFIRDVTATLIPSGMVIPYLSDITPTGWLMCNGGTVSRITYANLFAVVGTRYGAGDGATTFNLPDFRGRALIGSGQGSGLTLRSLGDDVGEESHILTVPELAGHTHIVNNADRADDTQVNWSHFDASGESFSTDVQKPIQPTNAGSTQTTLVAASAGGDVGHNTMQPSSVVSWLVKT